MSTLHGYPVDPGDTVYDTEDGYGCVESVLSNCIWVRIGRRTKRRYTKDGFTGKRCRATLFWHPPPAVVFAKESCVATEQRKFLENAIQMLNSMSKCGCNEVNLLDEECENCGCIHPCETLCEES